MGLTLAALLLAAGCGQSGGAAPGASAAAAPASPTPAPVPQAGQCYDRPLHSTVMTGQLVDCAQPHQSEIIFVGRLDLASAEMPASDNKSLVPADTDCRAKTAAFTGTRLGRRGQTFELGLPGAAAWSAGARWYACEAILVDPDPGHGAAANVTGSLKGGPTGPVCLVDDDPKTLHNAKPIDCAQPHRIEYIGAVRATFGLPDPKNDDEWKPFQVACRDEIADQMGVSTKAVDQHWGYNMYAASGLWAGGVTVAQCYFVLLNKKTITGSVLGSKGKNIPESW